MTGLISTEELFVLQNFFLVTMRIISKCNTETEEYKKFPYNINGRPLTGIVCKSLFQYH